MKKLLLFMLNLSLASAALAQDSTAKASSFFLNGYIKDMQTFSIDSNFRNVEWGNLIHNRVNLKWKPSEKITGAVEVRSRILYSDAPELPAGSIAVRNANEYLNMQEVWVNNHSVVFTSNVERLYFDYRTEKFNLRVGRQRINWGMATTWNPNDIFNSYNFLDFDYEERPGTDGAKLKYMLGNTSNLEFACAHTSISNGNIAAVKYSLNKWNYDFQIITGVYYNKPTAGVGWTGYIGDAGFKGEAQYFSAGRDSTGHLNLTMETDYKFAGDWYVNFGLLYNNYGLSGPVDAINAIDLNLSPKNLMPTKWNLILTTTKQFSPRLSASTTLLFSPGTNFFILFPSLQYNLMTNLDLDVFWQSFFAEVNNDFKAMRHLGYLRLKFNF
ncbi:MAG: hypothetical protein JSU01_00520 [Bacteroidetes bacterium]|nr:hypothetical protein [Bacteroidota bacterium]